jgi:hypothetical protein
MKPEKAAVSLDRLLVTYSTWFVLIQRLRQDSLCLILSSVLGHRSRAGRFGQGDAVDLPGPLTRLASDHSEQRQWSAPASFARAPTPAINRGATRRGITRVGPHLLALPNRVGW